MATIRWTDTAEDTYLALLQMQYDQSTQAALLLDEQLEKLLERLGQFKFHCPPLENFSSLRRCQVTRHIGLVYHITEDEITIISVFDSRTNHPFQ